MIIIVAFVLAAAACSKKKSSGPAPYDCLPGQILPSDNGLMAGGVATISGTATGALPGNGSFACAVLVPVGAGYLIAFSDSSQAFAVNYQIGAPSTQTVTSSDIGAVNVTWGQGFNNGFVTGGYNAVSCLTSATPPGTLSSDGTITWTGIPTGTSAAASFSIPALCDANGHVLYNDVSGSFQIP